MGIAKACHATFEEFSNCGTTASKRENDGKAILMKFIVV